MKNSRLVITLMLLTSAVLFLSCGDGGNGEGETGEPAASKAEGDTLDYIREDVSFGFYFDEEGTKRTIELEEGEETFTGYVILKFPEHMTITGVEWRLVLPEGVTVVNDKYNEKRVLSMGTMEKGISEGLRPCVPGPSVVLHTLTLRKTGPLTDAVISIMPSLGNEYLGVTECKEGYPMITAASYKAVINPSGG